MCWTASWWWPALRKEWLRAGRLAGQGRRRAVQHVQRAPACRKQDIQRPGPAKHAKEQQPEKDYRRLGLHGAERSAADFRAGAVCRSGRRPRAARTRCRGCWKKSPPNESPARRQQMAVSLGRKDGSREEIERSHESFDPAPRSAMRPTPFQAYVRIRSAATSSAPTASCRDVRGPEQGRPPRAILAEAATAGRPRLQGNHADGPNGQQLQARERRSHDAADPTCSSRLHDIDGIERLKFVTNYPKDMTDDLLAGRARSAEVLAVLARAGSKRQQRRARSG